MEQALLAVGPGMTSTKHPRDSLMYLRAFAPIATTDRLLGIVDALVEAGLAPTHYGLVDGSVRLRFTRDAIAKDARKILEKKTLLARGASGLSINLDDWSCPMVLVGVEIVPAPTSESKERWLQAADRFHELLSPEFLLLGWGPSLKIRQGWRDDRERTEILMSASMDVVGDYYNVGPCGLGMRTYLCKHYADLLGADTLSTLPASVTTLGDGSVRVDLADDLVATPFAELVDRWEACMRHLAPYEVFCVPRIVEERCSIWYDKPSARFSFPPREER